MSKILIFDPSNTTSATAWKTYNGIEFELAPLLVTDLRRIIKEVNDLGLGEVAAANEQDSRVADHIIRDWRGPVLPDRTKLPLTKVNKFGLVNALPGLKSWMQAESDRVAADQMIKDDSQLGNSEASPAGSPGDLAVKTDES